MHSKTYIGHVGSSVMLIKRFFTKVFVSILNLLGLARLHLTPNISIGDKVSCAVSARMRATDGGALVIASYAKFLPMVEISVQGGIIRIGQRTHIGQGAIIVCKEEIKIGSDCLIAEYVTIRDQNHIFGAGKLTSQSGFKTARIDIGNNVWIGGKATILAGVKIGDNSVIGAGSVVTHDIPANTISVGNPARTIRTIS